MTDVFVNSEASSPTSSKQCGDVYEERNGRVLEGRTWDELPKGHLLQV